MVKATEWQQRVADKVIDMCASRNVLSWNDAQCESAARECLKGQSYAAHLTTVLREMKKNFEARVRQAKGILDSTPPQDPAESKLGEPHPQERLIPRVAETIE